MFRYSASCILSFRPIAIISSLLALIPLYDFSKRKLTHKKCYFAYSLSLKALLLCLFSLWFADRYEKFKLNISFAFDIIGTTMWCLIILSVTNCKSNARWEELFQRFAFLESVLNLNTEYQREHNILNSPVFRFIMGLICMIMCSVATILFFHKAREPHKIFNLICHIYSFVISLIITGVSTAVRRKFSDVNKKLITCKNAHFYIAINIVRNCRYIYQELGTIVDIINCIFGPAIFFMFFMYGFHTLNTATDVFDGIKSTMDVKLYAVSVLITSMLLVSLVFNFICLVCNNKQTHTYLRFALELSQ